MKITNDIKVIIADDHELFRDGLKNLLSSEQDISVVAEAENGEVLINLCEELDAHVAVVDIRMPYKNGIECTKLLSLKKPDMGVVILSMFDEEHLIVSAINAGASGYLLKNAEKSEILDAVRSVYIGRSYYCKKVTAKLACIVNMKRVDHPIKNKDLPFSNMELKIIELICQEFTNREIAKKLFISPRTVEGYRLKILEKTSSRNTVGIVLYATRHKIV